MGHKGYGTQRVWDTKGMGHKEYGTQRVWETKGMGHKGYGAHRPWGYIILRLGALPVANPSHSYHLGPALVT